MSLVLDVRMDGFEEPVGALARADSGRLAFVYDAAYTRLTTAIPLSLSMPLSDEPFDDIRARAFFGNLLQERDRPLQRVMDREGLARDDIAGLLYHLGADCPGAISVLPQGAPAAKIPGDYARDYRIIEQERLERIVEALQLRQPLPDDSADPSPLAGVQSKIAVTRLPSGELAEPLPGCGAPTTHILKVPDTAHKSDAALENAAMRLAGAIGFSVAETKVVEIAGIEVLLVDRFDRALSDDGRIVRLHQEDFAQALGLPPSLKYERYGKPGRRFDTPAIRKILDSTAQPSQAILTFINSTIYDLLVGNVDAHAKNFALIHGRNGQTRLAPRYDILPTRLDPKLTDEFAYSIGSANTFDALRAEDMFSFLADLGITNASGQKRIANEQISLIGERLLARLADLDRSNLKRFADLIASNVGNLFSTLGMAIPSQVTDRDAYVEKGGGWALGS